MGILILRRALAFSLSVAALSLHFGSFAATKSPAVSHGGEVVGAREQSLPFEIVQRRKMFTHDAPLAAEASDKVYNVFSTFWDTTNPAMKFKEIAGLPGFFLPVDNGPQPEALVPKGYKIKAVISGRALLAADRKLLKKTGRSDLFWTIYEASPPDPKKPPIFAIKGTSTTLDWTNNIFNHGAAQIKGLLTGLLDFSNDNSVTQARAYQKWLLDIVAPGGQPQGIIFTGHSLGGAIAENLAAAVTQISQARLGAVPPIHIVTFNPLAGAAMFNALGNLRGSLFPKFDKTPTEFPNIHQLNVVTSDDPMQTVNRIFLKTKALRGETYVLPSERNFREIDGRLGLAGRSITGHRMVALRQDLQFIQSPGAESKMRKMLAAMPSLVQLEKDLADANHRVLASVPMNPGPSQPIAPDPDATEAREAVYAQIRARKALEVWLANL